MLFLGHSANFLTQKNITDALDCTMLLENVPSLALYNLDDSTDNVNLVNSLSRLFRSLINVDWLINSLATCIGTAGQRSNELGANIGREQEWKKEINSTSFETLINRRVCPMNCALLPIRHYFLT